MKNFNGFISKLKKTITPLVIVYIITAITGFIFNILLIDYFIAHSDLRFPLSFTDFLSRHIYIWSSNSGAVNLDGTVRTFGRLPIIISYLVSQNQIIASYFFILYTMIFGIISFYIFSNSVLEIKDKSLNLILSFIFVLNPIFLGNFSKIGLVFSAYLIPLLIACVNQIFVKRRVFPYSIYILILLNLSFVHPFNLVVNIIITSLFLFSKLTSKVERDFFVRNFSKFFSVLIIGVLMNIYIIVPLVSIGTVDKQILSNSIGEGADTLNLIDISRNKDIFESLTLTKSIFVDFAFYDENYKIWYESSIFLLYIFIVILFAINYKSFSKKDKSWFLFQLASFIILIFLATGSAYPFIGNLLKFLTETIFGWIFRSPLKWQLYIPFTLVILTGLVIKRISNYNLLSLSKIFVSTLAIISSLFILFQVYNNLITPKRIVYFPQTANVDYSNKKVLLANDINCRELLQNYDLRNEMNVIFSSETTTFKILNDPLLYNNYSVYSLFDYVVTCNQNYRFPQTFIQVASDSNFGIRVHKNNNSINNILTPQQLVNTNSLNLANEEFNFFYKYTNQIPLSTTKNDKIDSRYLTKVFSPFETSNINEPFSQYNFSFNVNNLNQTKLISDNSIQSLFYRYTKGETNNQLEIFSNLTPTIQKDKSRVFGSYESTLILSKTVPNDNEIYINVNNKIYGLEEGENFLTYSSLNFVNELIVVDTENNLFSDINSQLSGDKSCFKEGRNYVLRVGLNTPNFEQKSNCPDYQKNLQGDQYLLNLEYEDLENNVRPDYLITINSELDKQYILKNNQFLEILDPALTEDFIVFKNRESESKINFTNISSNRIIEKEKFVITPPLVPFDEIYINTSNNRIDLTIPIEDRIVNLVTNGDFENGLWQSQVDDCYNYDNFPQIAMELEKSDTNKALLKATRHIACTATDIDFQGIDQVLLSLDYDIKLGERGGYSIRFNDIGKTEFREVFRSQSNGKSGTVRQTVDIPEGATSGKLTLYAFQSDEVNENAVSYDNINIYPVTILKDKYFILEDSESNTNTNSKTIYNQISPSKRELVADNLTGDNQILFFNEGYSDKWQLLNERGKVNTDKILINNLVTAFQINSTDFCSNDDCKFIFEFKEQNIFIYSLIISGVVWLGVLGYCVYCINPDFSIFKSNRKKNT
jgi:hypothetical protein